MGGRALCAGLLGAALGAAACYRVTKRDWWTLNGVLSIGAALMLGVVTEGSSSREEHEIVTVIAPRIGNPGKAPRTSTPTPDSGGGLSRCGRSWPNGQTGPIRNREARPTEPQLA
jgi:hypothetical protein